MGLLMLLVTSTFAASVISTIDGGGGRSTSASYVNNGRVGGIAGISTVASPPETVRAGYIGQLTEVVSLAATGTPATVNQGATSQLTGMATLDDATVTMLTGGDIAWGVVTYPFQSVDNNGVLTAVANVYAAPVGTVNGLYLGATSSASVQVLGPYANAGIPDSWFVQYFGIPTNSNPNAAPTADADGDGVSNLHEYLAGVDPTNSASVPLLNITAVQGASATQMKAIIQWTTDVLSDSEVMYGTSRSTATNVVSVAGNVTNHTVQLNALTPGTVYYYEVVSASSTNHDQSVFYAFTTTTPCPCQ